MLALQLYTISHIAYDSPVFDGKKCTSAHGVLNGTSARNDAALQCTWAKIRLARAIEDCLHAVGALLP